MTRFSDGPAKGVTLMLRRAPMFLRAVRSKAGEWDGLDQLNDTPALGETIVVYKLVGEPLRMHICGSKASGWYEGGEYRVVETQPDEETLRFTGAWRSWAKGQADANANE